MVIPYGFKSRLSHQIKNLHFSVGSLFLCQKTGSDLNPLAEGEHNRVFASETQRMMGRAHQVPSLAPKKELRNSEALFLSNPKDWYVITLQRVCNCRRRMASPWCMQSFVLITYRNKFRITFTALQWLHTQPRLRFHTMLRIDLASLDLNFYFCYTVSRGEIMKDNPLMKYS